MKCDNAGQRPAEPVPSDYDENPGRVRLARSVLHRYAAAGDVHELVAWRFIARVLDVGCGEGELALSSKHRYPGTRISTPLIYLLADPSPPASPVQR